MLSFLIEWPIHCFSRSAALLYIAAHFIYILPLQRFLTHGTGRFENPTFQLAQASLLMNELNRLRQNQPSLPIILCGDLNSTRKSLVRDYILHGMPTKHQLIQCLSGDVAEHELGGEFSVAWQREFNKQKRENTWIPDCFPWQQLWFGEGDSLLPIKPTFPLLDAFEELHSDAASFTNPGDNLIIDHMLVLVCALAHCCCSRSCLPVTTALQVLLV